MASLSPFVLALPLAPSKDRLKPVSLSNQQFGRNPVISLPKRVTGHACSVNSINGAPNNVPIKKSTPVLVHPAATTPNGLYYLTGSDQNLMGSLEILYSYKGNGMESKDKAYKVIKKALSEVLVHYYPLAGRLTMTEDGNYMVNCAGEGVHFVEAVIEQDLDEFGDITTPDAGKLRNLINLPESKDISDMPLLTVQVTSFKCGGFIIGIKVDHCMMDGTSIDQFMNSWAKIARGLPLSVTPFLDRSILKPRPLSEIEFPQNFFSKTDDLFCRKEVVGSMAAPEYKEKVYTSVHFSSEILMELKKTVMDEGIERLPTNFELITAVISRAVIRCRKLEKLKCTKFLFPVNVRAKLGASFPEGYFGNCIGAAYMRCDKGEQYIEAPLSVIVKQVQETLKSVTVDYFHALLSYAEAMGLQMSAENAFTFSNLARMSAYKTDFGLGDMKQFGFATLPENGIYFLPQRKIDRNNFNVVLGLSPSATEIFQESIKLKNQNKIPILIN